MKFDIARQPLMTAVPVLLLVAAAALSHLPQAWFPGETATAAMSWGGERIARLQGAWPRLSNTAAVLLLLATGLTLGRLGMRYNLYGVGTCLPISLFGLLGCGIFFGPQPLATAFAGWLFARALHHYCASLRNGYTFSALFRAALYLGALPLVEASVLPLTAVAVWALLLFRRTLREAVITAGGILLVPLAVCYGVWGAGGSFIQPLLGLWHAFLRPPSVSLFEDLPIVGWVQICTVLFLILCAALFFLGDRYSAGTKVRMLLTFLLGVLLLCTGLIVVPQARSPLFTLCAVPASLLLPFLFVRIRRGVAAIAYAWLLILCILRFLLPIVY